MFLFPPNSSTEPLLWPEAHTSLLCPGPYLGLNFTCNLLVAEEAGKPEPEEEDVRVEAESRKEAVLRPGGQRRGRASKAGGGKELHL